MTILFREILFIVLFAVILTACQQANHETLVTVNKKSIKTSGTDKKQFSLNNNDTLIISKTCAVIIIADSIQIERRKKALGEDFYAGADDYAFYLNETGKFLDSAKLTTLECKGRKWLKFVYTDRTQELLNLSNLEELWMIYFFTPCKKSKQADMTMIDQEYREYFK